MASAAPASTGIVHGYNDQVRYDVLGLIPEAAGAVLDVGGGTGATVAHLKRTGRAARGGSFDLARPEASAEVDFRAIGDLSDPGFLDGALSEHGPFDTILCLDVLEHLVDPWSVVARLHQALRPGGAIVASLPNVRHYRVSGGLLLAGQWDLQDAGILDRTHLRFFVRRTMIELMTHSGLVLEEVQALPADRHARQMKVFRRLTRGRLDELVSVRFALRVRRPQA